MKKLLLITIALTFFSIPAHARTVVGCSDGSDHGSYQCTHSSWHEFWGIKSSCSRFVESIIASGGSCWIE